MQPEAEHDGLVAFRYTRAGGDDGYIAAVESWTDVLINALDRDHWVEQLTGQPGERVFTRETPVSGVERLEFRWEAI